MGAVYMAKAAKMNPAKYLGLGASGVGMSIAIGGMVGLIEGRARAAEAVRSGRIKPEQAHSYVATYALIGATVGGATSLAALGAGAACFGSAVLTDKAVICAGVAAVAVGYGTEHYLTQKFVP